MTGGCQCGAIRYEITSFPLLLYTCNCTDCQRQTGSAFALNMPVRFKDFRILQGEWLAPHLAQRHGSDLAVLRHVRHTALRRTRRAAGNRQPSCRNAR
jgi:hypothetical protein